MADPIRYLSLFAGIGGLDLAVHRGLERLGIGSRCVGMVEGEAFAAVALAAAMERGALAPCPVWLGDVREFPAAAFAGSVDLVVAGFPCPPVSSAGKRRGVEDERWLWPEVVRCLRDSGARYLFVENVRGLLSANGGRAFGDVLGDLADLGFDAEWVVRSAADVGAPHRRERVFVLGHRDESRADTQRATGGPRRAVGEPGECVAHGHGEGCGERGERDSGSGAGIGRALRGDADRRDPAVDHAEDADGWRGESGEPGEPERGWRGHRGAGAARLVGDGDGDGSQGLTAPGAAAGATVGAGRGVVAHAGRVCGARLPPDGSPGCGRRPGAAGSSRLPDAPGRLDDQLVDRPGHPGGWPRPFPPGPGDRAAWAAVLEHDQALAPAVEPGLRDVDDGVPARLVLGGRADQLRGLGNAVVPECGAVAFAELWGRLT